MSAPPAASTAQKVAILSSSERIAAGQEAITAFKSSISNFLTAAKDLCGKSAAFVVGTIINTPNDIKAIAGGINNFYGAAKERVHEHFELQRIQRLEKMETKLVQDITKKIQNADILPETKTSLLTDLRKAIQQGHDSIEAAKQSGGRLTADEAAELQRSVKQTLAALSEQVGTVIAQATEEKRQSDVVELNAKRLAELEAQMREIAQAKDEAEKKKTEAAGTIHNPFSHAAESVTTKKA